MTMPIFDHELTAAGIPHDFASSVDRLALCVGDRTRLLVTLLDDLPVAVAALLHVSTVVVAPTHQ
jgi:hypothetical protein